MRRVWCLVVCVVMMWPAVVWGEGARMEVCAVDEVIRPGKAVLLSMVAPENGEVDLCLEDERGNELSVIVLGYEVSAGVNQVYWNGTYGGYPAPEGRYQLVMTMNGERASTPVEIGPIAPYLNNIQVDSLEITPDSPLFVMFYAGSAGRITTGMKQGNEWYHLASWAVEEGDNVLLWDGSGADYDGEIVYTLQLTDEDGATSTEEHLTVTLTGFGERPQEEPVEGDEPEAGEGSEGGVGDAVAQGDAGDVDAQGGASGASSSAAMAADNDQSQYTPSYGSPYAGVDTGVNYWTMPMDITDEAAIWAMLMQPVTVLDNGKKNGERTQEIVYQEPSTKSKGIGVVTCLTQGVHVLEKGDEWTLIEAYSSSFHDSAVKNWNTLIQGYVPTRLLKTVKPNQTMGLVIDKLTQRMYIFREGKLYDTLLVSTGVANPDQPYNETRSGEFLLQNPAVGQFKSDNLICSMGIRFNSGDLLHEVPHTLLKDGGRNYTSCEPKLGTKASHGCIRVQRVRTPLGTNMTWVWNHRADEMKLVVWEDWQGRVYPYPEDDMTLYYNPKGGEMYHTAATCYAAPKVTFQPFTYAELDDADHAKLTRCKFCCPPLRKAEIDEINALYAPGGDHDPVMTQARAKAQAALGLTD